MSRLIAYPFGLGLALAVVSPALRGAPDSYPLSTYPMFAAKRHAPRVYVMEGVSESGARQRIAPRLIATDEVMQAAATVKRAVLAGEPRMSALCSSVAARVATQTELASVRALELTSAEYEPVSYFVSGPAPRNRIVHHRCAVAGGR